MSPKLALPLTILVPAVPWLALSPWWVASRRSSYYLVEIFFAGLAADFWWGRSLGGFSLVLLALTGLIYWAKRVWPGGERSLTAAAVILSAAALIIYWSR